MGSYPHIFTPGRIGHVTVRNRTVMPSMGTNMSDHGFVNDAIVNHYVERAREFDTLNLKKYRQATTGLYFFVKFSVFIYRLFGLFMI